MMKMIGIAMIAISCTLIGILYYLNIKARPNELNFFISLLSEYHNQLKWQQKSLEEIVSNFKYNGFENYLITVNKLIKEEGICDSFITKNDLFTAFHLTTDDKKILMAFFEQTGFSGLDTELNLVSKTLSALESLKEEAMAKFKRLGPFSIKLSIVCGIWIIILLF